MELLHVDSVWTILVNPCRYILYIHILWLPFLWIQPEVGGVSLSPFVSIVLPTLKKDLRAKVYLLPSRIPRQVYYINLHIDFSRPVVKATSSNVMQLCSGDLWHGTKRGVHQEPGSMHALSGVGSIPANVLTPNPLLARIKLAHLSCSRKSGSCRDTSCCLSFFEMVFFQALRV